MTLRCPRDRTLLRTATSDGFRVERCPRCSGLAVTVAMLRRVAPRERLQALWRSVSAGSPGDPCPSCAKPLLVAPVQCGASTVELDACRTCQLLWFDAEELSAFSPEPRRAAPQEDLSPKAREAFARARLDATKHREKPTSWTDGVAVDIVLGVLEGLLTF